MRSERQAKQAVKPSPADLAGVENFVRLQESQEEFLKWLESSEKKNPELDRYSYKKVR